MALEGSLASIGTSIVASSTIGRLKPIYEGLLNAPWVLGDAIIAGILETTSGDKEFVLDPAKLEEIEKRTAEDLKKLQPTQFQKLQQEFNDAIEKQKEKLKKADEILKSQGRSQDFLKAIDKEALAFDRSMKAAALENNENKLVNSIFEVRESTGNVVSSLASVALIGTEKIGKFLGRNIGNIAKKKQILDDKDVSNKDLCRQILVTYYITQEAIKVSDILTKTGYADFAVPALSGVFDGLYKPSEELDKTWKEIKSKVTLKEAVNFFKTCYQDYNTALESARLRFTKYDKFLLDDSKGMEEVFKIYPQAAKKSGQLHGRQELLTNIPEVATVITEIRSHLSAAKAVASKKAYETGQISGYALGQATHKVTGKYSQTKANKQLKTLKSNQQRHR